MRIEPGDGVDLHIHTNVEGGAWNLRELADCLAQSGIRVAAATDHNTVTNVQEIRALANARGVRVIPATELDVSFAGRFWHLLLYGVDVRSPELEALFREAHAINRQGAQAVHAALIEMGYRLPPFSEIDARRPVTHMADVVDTLVERGYVEDWMDGFRLVDSHQLMYRLELVARFIPLERAIAVAHAQGALAVLAHPGREIPGAQEAATADVLEGMIAVGLDGVEAHYRTHSQEQVNGFAAFARQRGLLVTCGSDSHSPQRPPMGYEAWLCTEFLGRWGIEVE